MVMIYILQLEDKKYYVGRSNIPKQRILKHFQVDGSEWTKLYTPINIITQFSGNNFDEEKHTLIYMKKYGIDNVRGGSFCKIVLSNSEKNIITQMINSIDDACFKCGMDGHFIKDCKIVNNNQKLDIKDKDKIIVNDNNGKNGLSTHYIENPFSITTDNIAELFMNSLSGLDYDIANFFYKLNEKLFVCAQETPRSIWYMYNEGLWERLEGSAIIRKKVENTLLKIYNDRIEELKNITNAKLQEQEYNAELILKIKSIIGHNLKTYKKVTEIIHQLTKFFKNEKFMEKIDANPEIICFGKDLFDLKICGWRETSPNDYCTLKCGVLKKELNSDHEELLKKILLDIFTTEERTVYMINTFSMFLNGCNPGQKFHIWLGGGANGKSLLETYFEYSFGDYFCELPTTLITHEESGPESANPTLCAGRGRRVAFFAEPAQGKKANNSLLKKWSGGEKISCRALYENPSQYSVFFKTIILCNVTFEFQDIQDDSIPRRTDYVNFKTKFDSDPKFEFQKLKVEEYMSIEFCNMIKGSFMNMLINNYIKLKENNYKFNVPVDITNDKNDFLNNNDEVKVFIATELIKTDNENNYITLKELFKYFMGYCKNNNIKINIKEKTFRERVGAIIPFKERHNGTVDGKRVFLRSVFTNIIINEGNEGN
jgi:phage/plasmid-associated DNA primase/predicted GIY-YIG superfamily endonuclease